MEIAEHIAIVAAEAKLFAAAADEGSLETPIPTCPDWNMRDLVRHLSEIHLWAAARVAKRTDQLWLEDRSELTESWPDLAVFWPEDDDLTSWYLQTNANLVDALESAPADLDCPTFLPAPSPLAMWARRQAHETAVHRFDAENAVRTASGFDPEFAADGIDELLAAFTPRRESFPVESEKLMQVSTDDTDDSWLVTLRPDGVSTARGLGSADITLSGTASDLYTVLWNRASDSTITIDGEREILDLWHGNSRIRWTN
jgi:uncharacterized protein (TIGR03083 family)